MTKLLTGEYTSRKKIGDKVIAAATNKTGYFKFENNKGRGITTFAQVGVVEEASSSKAPAIKQQIG